MSSGLDLLKFAYGAIRPLRVLGALFLLAAAGGPCPAQEPLRDPLNRQLPSWLTLGVESRFRLEGVRGLSYVEGRNDGYLLSRQRLRLGVRPKRWLRFFAEAQDAREANTDLPGLGNFRDELHLRRAYVVLGDEKDGWWDLKAGRQELAFGFERLIGINEWANTPRTFDAVKLGLHRGEDRVDIFSASVAVIEPDGFDRARDGDNVHGVYASLKSVLPRVTFEPFLVWRTRPRVTGEGGFVGDADIYTSGARLESELDSSWSFQTEIEGQWGAFGRDDLRAWRAFGGMAYEFSGRRWKPRLVGEYTFGSGDARPGDGRIGTYEQIYVRAHRIWGIADQVGGRNSRILLAGAHFRPSARWLLRVDHHWYWLANRHDGLYRHNGRLVVPRIPGGAGSTYIGNEIGLQLSYEASRYWRAGAGVGHLFPGGFLELHTPGGSFTYPFVFLQFTL